MAVSGSEDATVRLWDLAKRRQVGAPLTGHAGAVYSLDCTVLSGRLIAVSGGHTDAVWSVAALEINGRPTAISSSNDRTVRMWDLAAGEQIGPSFTPHPYPVCSIGIEMLKGQLIAITGGFDTTVRTWDLSTRLNLAPSPPDPVHNPRTFFSPARVTPIAA